MIYATAEPADQDELVVVRDLMRDQLESFGIAEPDVRVEGKNIIVDLPGVSDQSNAFDALKVSGIVELRPVLQCQAGSLGDTSTSVPGQQRAVRHHGSAVRPPRRPLRRQMAASNEGAAGFAGGAGSMFARGLPPILAATPSSTTPPTPTTAPPVPVTTGPIIGPTLPTTTRAGRVHASRYHRAGRAGHRRRSADLSPGAGGWHR